MAASSFSQSSFLGGELSPYAQGRFDLPLYKNAMTLCRNAFPLEEGTWLRRSGTMFAGTTYGGAKGRNIKYDFEQAAAYLMELTAGKIRFRATDTSVPNLTNPLLPPARLVTTNDEQFVTDISSANPAVVTTFTAHGWTNGDQVEFLFGQVAAANQTPLLCNRVFTATVTGASTFSLADALTGAAIDGSTLGWIAQAQGDIVVARILVDVSSYTVDQLDAVVPVQAETQMVLLHNEVAPTIVEATSLPSPGMFASFRVVGLVFSDGPYMDPPTDGSTLTPSANTGTINLTASAATSINGGQGFLSTDVGRLIRIFSEPAAWDVGATYAAGDTVTYNGAYFVALQASTGSQPDVAVAYWAISTTAAVWSFGVIKSVTTTLVVSFEIDGPNLVNTSAISTWRLGLYSDTTGYPTCGTYYEGRLWLAGAVANRVDASEVNGFLQGGDVISMKPTATDGTISDANGISYIFNATDVNPIFWMAGNNSGIVCGTLAGEWLVSALTTGPITPTNIQAHRGTTYGSANIQPAHTELTLSFVQRYGRNLLEYFPDVYSGRFLAPNLAMFAKHLTASGVEEIRYQQERVPVVWMRCGDGSLAGATYKRESLFSNQGPTYNGWHRHDLGSGRITESITVGPSPDGTLDAVALVTNDEATPLRHVEIMQNIFDMNDTITDSWFLDDAIVPSGGIINGTALTLYGLWHLNGKTVSAWCCGLDCGNALVTNGSMTLTIDGDPTNPETLSTDGMIALSNVDAYGALSCRIQHVGAVLTVPCVIGFTFTSQGQLLRPDTQEQDHSPLGMGLGKTRRIAQFAALLNNTQGISFGTGFSSPYVMRTALFKTAGGRPYNLTQLFSGVHRDVIDSTSDLDNRICWQVTRPYPAAICALEGFMQKSEQ